jgi:hypothetical protein
LHRLTAEYAVVFGGEMGFSISSEVDEAMQRERHSRHDEAHGLFVQFMTSHGVPLGEAIAVGGSGPSAARRGEDGRQNAVIGMKGRVWDLVILEQPDRLASIAEATLEDAIFESGRPVLMVPKTAPPTLGEVIAIACNGSTETATTIALTMPLLERASWSPSRRN